jgi:hypothetical protein
LALLSLIFVIPGMGCGKGGISPGRPVVIGDLEKLSNDEIVELRSFSRTMARGPWLISAKAGQLGHMAQLYLSPETDTGAFRRGAFLTARLGLRDPSGRRSWSHEENFGGAYAQVAVEGRSLNDVQGDRDIMRPFEVTGAFDDMELVSLIRFIRSKPTSPISNQLGASKPVSGDQPVSSVGRMQTLPQRFSGRGLLGRMETSQRRLIEGRLERPNPDGYVVVWIDLGPSTSEEVILEKTGNDWVVISAVWGVA